MSAREPVADEEVSQKDSSEVNLLESLQKLDVPTIRVEYTTTQKTLILYLDLFSLCIHMDVLHDVQTV